MDGVAATDPPPEGEGRRIKFQDEEHEQEQEESTDEDGHHDVDNYTDEEGVDFEAEDSSYGG